MIFSRHRGQNENQQGPTTKKEGNNERSDSSLTAIPTYLLAQRVVCCDDIHFWRLGLEKITFETTDKGVVELRSLGTWRKFVFRSFVFVRGDAIIILDHHSDVSFSFVLAVLLGWFRNHQICWRLFCTSDTVVATEAPNLPLPSTLTKFSVNVGTYGMTAGKDAKPPTCNNDFCCVTSPFIRVQCAAVFPHHTNEKRQEHSTLALLLGTFICGHEFLQRATTTTTTITRTSTLWTSINNRLIHGIPR